MSSIAFLHTAEVHVGTFDRLLSAVAPKVGRDHVVRAEWLDEARTKGLTDTLRHKVRTHLAEAAARADAVVCTCSTLGSVADEVGAAHPNVMRIDRPMMEQAARSDGTVIVALCLESTVQPTLELLRSAYQAAGRSEDIEVVMCTEAWRHFELGDTAWFAEAIAKRVIDRLATVDNPGCVVLAQASMAVAEQRLADCGAPVYASPATALRAALDLIGR